MYQLNTINTGSIKKSILLTSMLMIFATPALSKATFNPSNGISNNLSDPAPYYTGVMLEPYIDTARYFASSTPTFVTDMTTINWGDSTSSSDSPFALTLGTSVIENLPLLSHIYSSPGIFTVTITDDWSVMIGGAVGADTEMTTETLTVLSSTTSATPLPAALPLFATGLGGLGLFGWRRKRKNAAAVAAA